LRGSDKNDETEKGDWEEKRGMHSGGIKSRKRPRGVHTGEERREGWERQGTEKGKEMKREKARTTLSYCPSRIIAAAFSATAYATVCVCDETCNGAIERSTTRTLEVP
jgi:hypothetical protein